MDLSRLSDTDLEAIANGKMNSLSNEALSYIASGGKAEYSPTPKETSLIDKVKSIAKAAVPYIRPTVEGLGAAGGGVVGFASPMPGGLLLGSGLGYAGAKNIMDTIEGDWAKTPQEAATRALGDIALGATYEMGGQVAVPLISKAAGAISSVAKPALGKISGRGLNSVEEAILSGEKSYAGNPFKSTTEFDKALRGKTTGDDVVENVKSALEQVKGQRAKAYQESLTEVSQNTKAIDLAPVKQDLEALLNKYNVKFADGQIDTSRVAMGKAGRKDIEDIVETVTSWGTKQGDDTAIGLDTLKRQLDDFYSESSQARQFVTEIKNKVKDAIVKDVPQYGEMTKGYADATNMIKEIETALALKKTGISGRITADQTLRRLTSAMKDDFQLRKEMLDILGAKASQDLSGQAAGYAMHTMLPGGLAGSGPATILAAINPKYAAAYAASSPRVQGEFLRLIGKMKGANNAVMPKTKSDLATQALIYANSKRKGEK